jgi:hypothetical protein
VVLFVGAENARVLCTPAPAVNRNNAGGSAPDPPVNGADPAVNTTAGSHPDREIAKAPSAPGFGEAREGLIRAALSLHLESGALGVLGDLSRGG